MRFIREKKIAWINFPFCLFKRTLPIYYALLGGNGNTPKKGLWQNVKSNKPQSPQSDTIIATVAFAI